MAYDARIIALAFAHKGIIEHNPVTQMQLQKMVFYAHGYNFAIYDGPLVEQDFEAWRYGPVIPDIYQQYKFYGSSRVFNLLKIDTPFNNLAELNGLSPRAKRSVDYTWNVTKKLDATILSAWTHQQGSPWSDVYEEDVNHIVIPNESIKSYFQRMLYSKSSILV
jgi:uncharacterized phage-associated protein